MLGQTRVVYRQLAIFLSPVLEDPRLISPGHPERSVLLYRIAHRGPGSGQMPQLATNLVDERAVKLFEDWILAMKSEENHESHE